MARTPTLPPRDQIADDAPLRLDVAAALEYPDGSMTASGLRREAARGRLTIERIAGKDFTTLANIERMRELCRVVARDHVCGVVPPAKESKRSGLSLTEQNRLPLAALRAQVR